jgi:hypothetical protein
MTLAGTLSGHPIRCWEWLKCGRAACKAYQSNDLRCWLLPHTSCLDGSTKAKERLLAECSACAVFAANRERASGKRLADRAALDTVDVLLAEVLEKASRLDTAQAEARGKSVQVTLLGEVGRALQRTMDLEEILLVILTAVTAGDGLGFNRAFLLLVDETTSTVRGRMAVGPSHPREAALIWKAMDKEDRSLGEILSGLTARARDRSDGITRLAERLVFPLSGEGNLVARSLAEGRSTVASGARDLPEAREIGEILGNDHFLVVPLVAEGKQLGAIIADNFVTGRRIRQEDVRLVETFASQAGLAILNASLHRKLQERIAELEQAHEELTHNQLQLLRAERMLTAGGLAATLVHDLKAPVISIGLMARAAASGLAGTSPVRETLERICQEILRIEDYLKHFARSAGRSAGKTEQVNVSHLVRDSLGALRTVMARGQVESAVNLAHGDRRVAGNKAELRQVLINLLYNSVEAMPEGGKITVSTGVDQGMLRISVADTGKGIPDDLKARVFSPFFTTKAEGSGLGLVIARRTVTNYGGRILLESGEGVGTCFTIYLPVTK